MKPYAVALLLALAGCSPGVYVRDGVTDGDTFYLAPQATMEDDPVLQSWVTYSLIKSTCQLAIGGENPARENSFDCELTARRHLAEAWSENRARAPLGDAYLDELLVVQAAGFLPEYVVAFFGEPAWQVPDDVDLPAFRRWRRQHLHRHQPVTRLVGFWSYRPL